MEHSYKFFKELLIEKLKPEKCIMPIEGKAKLFMLKYEFSNTGLFWRNKKTVRLEIIVHWILYFVANRHQVSINFFLLLLF